MTLQQLEYIVALDKYRHFVKAADSLGVTQSTLSTMIQKLENELDTVLFDRNSHPVRPTLLGEEIIEMARTILFNVAQLKEKVRLRKEMGKGELKLGIVSTIAPYILPKSFKVLSENYPDFKLFVEEAGFDALLQKLERAELDVAMLPLPTDNPKLLEIPLYKERFVTYISQDSPLLEQESISMEHLPDEMLWVLREGYYPADLFKGENNSRVARAIYEAGHIETLIKIVDENGGFTIIPELHSTLLRKCQQSKQIRPFSEPEPFREVALVVRRDFVCERLLNILVEAIVKVIPEHMVNERLKRFPIRL